MSSSRLHASALLYLTLFGTSTLATGLLAYFIGFQHGLQNWEDKIDSRPYPLPTATPTDGSASNVAIFLEE